MRFNSVRLPALMLLFAFTSQAQEPLQADRIYDGAEYVLYLPPQFDGKTPLGVLFLFDPMGNGRNALTRFRDGAAKLGGMVAASNVSRNARGFRENLTAAQNMWNDVQSRYPLDERRIYAGGFSG